jgi:hypothetical protein
VRETAGTDSVLRTQPCTASIRGVRRSCGSRRPSQLVSAILVVGNEPAAKLVHATAVAVRFKVLRSLHRYQSDKFNQCSAIIAVEIGKHLHQEYRKIHRDIHRRTDVRVFPKKWYYHSRSRSSRRHVGTEVRPLLKDATPDDSDHESGPEHMCPPV